MSQNSARRSSALLLAAVVAVLAGTLLDARSAVVYLYYWFFVAVVVGMGVAGVAKSPNAGRAIVVATIIAWILLLPHLRWNQVKSFYIDCDSIVPGMEVAEVRRLMSAYRLQREHLGDEEVKTPLNRAHLTFHPSLDHSADWCVVYTEAERVAGVEAIPD